MGCIGGMLSLAPTYIASPIEKLHIEHVKPSADSVIGPKSCQDTFTSGNDRV